MTTRIAFFIVSVLALIVSTAAGAQESVPSRIAALEPFIGSYPPQIGGADQANIVKKRYEELKAELDQKIDEHPDDSSLRYLRGKLQSMGHNLDVKGAWDGATNDLQAVLRSKPDQIDALLTLGTLWVNSQPALAPRAEQLFRAAQCYAGQRPIEQAQRGIFFALYYQGKMQAATAQSEYLSTTWPENDNYRQLRSIVKSVLNRKGEAQSELVDHTTTVTMATCSK